MKKACFVKMFLYHLEKHFWGSGVGSLMVCYILTYLCYSGLCRGRWWITLALTRRCCALQLEEDMPKNTSSFHGLRDITVFFFNGFGVRVWLGPTFGRWGEFWWRNLRGGFFTRVSEVQLFQNLLLFQWVLVLSVVNFSQWTWCIIGLFVQDTCILFLVIITLY